MQGMTPLHAAEGGPASVIILLGGKVDAETQTGFVARAHDIVQNAFNNVISWLQRRL